MKMNRSLKTSYDLATSMLMESFTIKHLAEEFARSVIRIMVDDVNKLDACARVLRDTNVGHSGQLEIIEDISETIKELEVMINDLQQLLEKR